MIGATSAAAAMVLGAALSAATPQLAPVDNLYSAAGHIDAIHCTSQSYYGIDVEFDGFGMPYDGHIFTIDLSADDMTRWMEEQGPIAVGDRVFCWMDSRHTTSILDDGIDHISK